MKFYVDEKQRKKRRRILRLKIYGGAAAFFILLIGLSYSIIYSPLFKIQQVNIRTSDAQELIGDLKIFLTNQSKIASVLGTDNILIWRKEKIGDFLKNYPQIAELKIEKDYFERRITIEIKEREKFGVWCLQTQTNADTTQTNADILRQSASSPRESACWWFDKSGVIFAEAPTVEGELINKVYDSTGRELKLGDKILSAEGVENLLANLLKIFEVLQKSELLMKNLYIQDLSLQEVIAQSPNLPKIYFSLRFDPESVLPAIQSIKELGLSKIEYIDFRVENRAYYKLK